MYLFLWQHLGIHLDLLITNILFPALFFFYFFIFFVKAYMCVRLHANHLYITHLWWDVLSKTLFYLVVSSTIFQLSQVFKAKFCVHNLSCEKILYDLNLNFPLHYNIYLFLIHNITMYLIQQLTCGIIAVVEVAVRVAMTVAVVVIVIAEVVF